MYRGGGVKDEDHSSVHLKDISFFENPFIQEIARWAVTEVFQKIWMEEKWDKCAKGGDARDSFKKNRDMTYQAHIFSGMSMALKVLDYKYYKKPIGEVEKGEITRKIKRSILGYLFHDYNKLDGTPVTLTSKKFIEENSKIYFKELMMELGLSVDDLYQIAFSTELGTEYNVNRNDVVISDLYWESSFSRLGDSLSSTFNKENSRDWAFKNSIYFNNDGIIPGTKIERIAFSSTNLIALTQIVRTSVIELIEKDRNFYLWSSLNAIYFVNEGNLNLNLKRITEQVESSLSRIVRPENGIRFTDRRVDNSSSAIGTITKATLREFVKDRQKFKNCLHLDDIKFNDANRVIAEKYSDLVSDKTSSFSFKYRAIDNKGISGLRQGLIINDYYDEFKFENERVRAFLVKYVQLTTKITGDAIAELREKLSGILDEYYDTFLVGLMGKKEHEKSTLLIPLVIGDENLRWNEIENTVIKDMNKEQPHINLENIVSRIISESFSELPEVPNKRDMSMVNGFPASIKATGETLFGLGTNTFNNRLPTSGISNGKIDIDSYYEFALRKNFLANGSGGGEALVFLHFPGSIPFIDLGAFYTEMGKSSRELNNFRELSIAIDAYDHNPKFKQDNEFFFAIDGVRSDASLLKYLYNMLEIAKSTKMMVRLAFSNAPIFDDQYATISLEIQGSVTTGMGYDKIRCNRINDVMFEIQTFNCLADGEVLGRGDLKVTSQIIRDFLQNKFSIFFHVHNLISMKKYEGRGIINLLRILDPFIVKIEELGYETSKEGVNKLENIKNLANAAYELVHLKYWDSSSNSSSNDRTWMMRDSLEALEKSKANVKLQGNKNLENFEDIICGVIFKTLERDKERNKWMPATEKITSFSKCLIKLLNDDFNGKIPSGQMKSYLINAFEFEYILTSKNKGNKEKGSDKNE